MKRFVIFLLTALMLLSLAACGDSPAGTTEGTKPEDNESEDSKMTTDEKKETTLAEDKTPTEESTAKAETEDESSKAETTTETDTIDLSESSSTESATESSTESSTEGVTEATTEDSISDETGCVIEEDITTETEGETEPPVVDVNAFPENGAEIVLANAEVYGWWDTYKFNKTNSDPFYRHEDIYYPVPLIFTWEADEEADYYRFFISTEEGFISCESYLLNTCSISLEHLFTGTDYYWTVISTKVVDGNEVNKTVVPTRSFTTAESPRCLRIEGVSNTRDFGGMDAMDGYRIKQGMVYRGGKLEGITDEGREFFVDVLGLKTDLDLRTPGEGGAGSGSPLGADINYVNINGRYYVWGMGIQSEEGKKVFAEEIRLFANPDNYPIYIHCSLGRDRTGTLAFVLQALLGASRNDMYMDYELSVFSVTGTLDNASIQAIRNNIVATYDYLATFEGSNLAEKTENYLLSIGITAEEIQNIRDLLLEEVK